MREAGCKTVVFSSSCTVYGNPERLPISEEAPVGATSSPYGLTKYLIERLLQDLHANDPEWNVSLLRYFNPVGAHPSGEIGENPGGYADNLMPFVCRTAAGLLEKLSVYGGDYPTPDGTCIRDYLHVSDLAVGHVAALDRLDTHPGLLIHNLGTGRGHSVLEVIEAFRHASGREIPYEITDRRPGDVVEIWADPARAERELGWKAGRSLTDMCTDAWRWQQNIGGP